jgi:tRNA1Val (adenine37-N6)-methyltransferase
MKVGTDGVLLGARADVSYAKKILDVGTGTGLIAIMCAQRSDAKIDAIEIDKESYQQACENISACPWFDRIKAHHISFQEYINNTKSIYDLIVCNPPFFRNSLKAKNKSRNLARHCDTLPFSDLTKGSSGILGNQGRLAVILPLNETGIFIAEASGFGLFCIRKTYIKTKQVSPSKRIIMEFAKTPENCREEILVIGKENHYSEEYKQLTGDFYLAF